MMRLVTLLTLSTLAFLVAIMSRFLSPPTRCLLLQRRLRPLITTGSILRAGVIPDTSTSSSSYSESVIAQSTSVTYLIIYITSIISASPDAEMPERQYVESRMYAFGDGMLPT
eukprot:scaffold14780_cov102-Skeletonema_dohrnii-CCMP3373.AAC.5